MNESILRTLTEKVTLETFETEKIANIDFINCNKITIFLENNTQFNLTNISRITVNNSNVVKFIGTNDVDVFMNIDTPEPKFIEFLECNDDIIIRVGNITNFDESLFPFYTYDITVDIINDTPVQFINIYLSVSNTDERVKIFKLQSSDIIKTMSTLALKLGQLRDQLFSTYLQQDTLAYLYMNDSIYEITGLGVNGLYVEKIDVYTLERASTFIEYFELTETLYFIFSSNDIVVVEEQLFNDGINIGSRDTLQPLFMFGYDFNKSLIIKFIDVLDIVSNSSGELLDENVELLSNIWDTINEKCYDVIEGYDLNNNSLLIFYRGELYTYNHIESMNIVDQLKQMLESNNDTEVLVTDEF